MGLPMMGDLLTRVVEPDRDRRPRWHYPAPTRGVPATVIAVTVCATEPVPAERQSR